MKKKTNEEYICELSVKNPNLEVIEKYVTAKVKIKHKCLKHNVFFDIDPDHALRGRGCKLCEGEHKSSVQIKQLDKYKQDLLIKNPNVEIIGEYLGARVKTAHRCKLHNIIWDISPDVALRGCGCEMCKLEKISEKNSLSHEQYMKRLQDINPYIIPLDKYTIGSVKIMHKCLVCGYEWLVVPFSILSGSGCPQCYMSHGERAISIYLKEHNINYSSQHTFDDCKYKYVLPFDFYLPDYNVCIEYDGGQHFKPVKWFGGEEGFRKTQERDEIKTQYCKNNNIPLLRIRYNQDIVGVLYEFLSQYNVISREAAS